MYVYIYIEAVGGSAAPVQEVEWTGMEGRYERERERERERDNENQTCRPFPVF